MCDNHHESILHTLYYLVDFEYDKIIEIIFVIFWFENYGHKQRFPRLDIKIVPSGKINTAINQLHRYSVCII